MVNRLGYNTASAVVVNKIVPRAVRSTITLTVNQSGLYTFCRIPIISDEFLNNF